MSPGRRRPVAASLIGSAALFGAILVLIWGGPRVPDAAHAAPDPRPNIVVVLTDDQTLAEMVALPQTTNLIGTQGMTFDRAYSSYPLCCPARATLLTGQYMHNHNVRGNTAPFGGWERFAGLGAEAAALPVWLQNSGYHTVQLGKYMNGYPSINPPVPPGWDEWYGKLSEYSSALFGNQVYFNYKLLEQGPAGPPAKLISYGQSETDYSTDVLADKAVDAIERLGGTDGIDEPFFLNLWVSAPHAPYISATRHIGAFGAAPVRFARDFNEKDVRDKPRFIRRLPRLNKRKIRNVTQRQRNRWAQLLAVDEAVVSVTNALAKEDELDNTYIVFTSDNGYLAGDHRIPQGKYLPYEGAAHVPLLIRGPGIAAGGRSPELVSNIDLAPTLAQIAGATPKLTVDGRSLLPFTKNPALASTRALLLEGDTGANLTGGEAIEAGDAASTAALKPGLKQKRGVSDLEQEPIARIARKIKAPAYRAIRTPRYLFVRYRGRGGVELYDMLSDPKQLRSRHADPRYLFIKRWLQSWLAVLETCAGNACAVETGPEPLPAPAPPPQAKKRPKRR